MMADGYYTYCGDQLVKYVNVKSLSCTPETNIIVYANYSSIKTNKQKQLIFLMR